MKPSEPIPEKAARVCLITGDARLSEVVRRHQPPGVGLHCATPADVATAHGSAEQELWIDLDETDGLPALAAKRRVYFHSRERAIPENLPAGRFIRKPCSDTVARVLWANPHQKPPDGRITAPARSSAWLPQWLLEYHELGVRELCRKCVNRLGARLGYADVSMYLYNSDEGVLTLAETTHRRPIDLAIPIPDNATHLMAAVARTGKPLVTRDAGGQWSARGLQRPPGRRRYSDGRCLIAPLVSGGKLWGVLNFSRSRQTQTTEVGLALDHVFGFIARALRYARAYERARTQARVDALTSLFNHRWMIETLTREIRRCQRSGESLSVALVDLDGLKAVNDRVGHSAGDALLRHVAGRITTALRQCDSAARVGGDEFVLLLPATDLEGARNVARRVLDSIRTDPAIFRGVALPMHASLGVAQWQADWTAEQLVDAADKAMYQAKQQGGNQVVCRTAELASEPGAAPVARPRSKAAPRALRPQKEDSVAPAEAAAPVPAAVLVRPAVAPVVVSAVGASGG